MAGHALKTLVLPFTEQLRALMMRHKFHGVCPYIPNFRCAFQDCCVHAGGRATLEGVQRRVSLEDEEMKLTHMLHRFGNTSSSSL